jgi:hypothetical protein
MASRARATEKDEQRAIAILKLIKSDYVQKHGPDKRGTPGSCTFIAGLLEVNKNAPREWMMGTKRPNRESVMKILQLEDQVDASRLGAQVPRHDPDDPAHKKSGKMRKCPTCKVDRNDHPKQWMGTDKCNVCRQKERHAEDILKDRLLAAYRKHGEAVFNPSPVKVVEREPTLHSGSIGGVSEWKCTRAECGYRWEPKDKRKIVNICPACETGEYLIGLCDAVSFWASLDSIKNAMKKINGEKQ